jgi:asparagine N-glycosylation enzyme membrane subunit Stt3
MTPQPTPREQESHVEPPVTASEAADAEHEEPLTDAVTEIAEATEQAMGRIGNAIKKPLAGAAIAGAAAIAAAALWGAAEAAVGIASAYAVFRLLKRYAAGRTESGA